MMITQSINLNLIPGGVLPRINVSQYDKGSRTLQFVLFDGPVLYSIESGTEITIQGSKPDNTAFQYDCTWQGSTVSMDIEQQMTAVAGDVICELVISNNGEILGTCNFILNVESAAVSDDTVISETELPLIERAVEAAVEAAASAASAAQSAEDAAGYVETVETAAQSAAQSATDASSSAGTAQTAAQSAAQSATDASSSAGTAQTAAQNAAQSATDASSSAGTAQTAAQNAAQSATDASGSASSASQSATDAAASAQAAAQSAASIGIATTSHAGIVKPDGTTITVDPDGTIHGNASVTVDSALSTTSTNPVQNKVITSALGKVEANIAPVETDPATSAWAVGRQIIFNDNLYEVITAISAGGSLVAYEDDPTNANIKLADPVETQLLNLKGNISNRNLIDNAWFTVNQREQSSYTQGTSYAYTVDRWRMYNMTLSVSSDGITLTPNASTLCVFSQYIENFEKITGKTVTISAVINGQLYSATGIFPTKPSSGANRISVSFGLDTLQLTFNAPDSFPKFEIATYDTTAISVRAVKLELGSISTLAMDTAPNYAEELLKCQRYFYRLHSGVAGHVLSGIQYNDSFRATIPIPSMRTTPTLYIDSGSFGMIWITDEGAISSISNNMTIGTFYNGEGLITLKENGLSTSAQKTALLKMQAGSMFDFSADL